MVPPVGIFALMPLSAAVTLIVCGAI